MKTNTDSNHGQKGISSLGKKKHIFYIILNCVKNKILLETEPNKSFANTMPKKDKVIQYSVTFLISQFIHALGVFSFSNMAGDCR